MIITSDPQRSTDVHRATDASTSCDKVVLWVMKKNRIFCVCKSLDGRDRSVDDRTSEAKKWKA